MMGVMRVGVSLRSAYRLDDVRAGGGSAAGAAPAIERAARLGDGWIAGPGVVVAEAAAQLRVYRDRCEAHGRAPGATVIRRDIHVGADGADASRVAGPVLARG